MQTRTMIFLALSVMSGNAMAGLIVSNWIATPTTLNFDITGTIDAGVTFGPSQMNSLFIGPANLGNQPGASTVSGTWLSLGGVVTALSSATLYSDSDSDKLQVRKSSNWLVGDILNYSFSFSDPDLVDLSGFDITGAIVSVGRSDYMAAPESAYQVGTFAAVTSSVPAPATLLLFGLGLAGLGFSKRTKV
ncbi:PEP-CTERM sorting domain-containing protein [Rheinheimera salexigens]|uniref:Ice-binding protein C-terminal domain-containing protein n=1 Tax=Rheinheimera salexigens TaxID=1628148 RepID=A0A1E7Q6B1_9GAMM|nr:PEP-CTERM sorting domain-containing protein [Rheinheimera salexigens]OEY69588.1 hypothetical protein BI198_08465 [Rheinheimera salexigens]